MLSGIKAIIFDMDGVIIDSEHLWRQVMIKSFTKIGIPFTEDHCRITTGMRFKDVITYWFNKYAITTIDAKEFDAMVINELADHIKNNGKPMEGVFEALHFFKSNKYKIALGTSSDIKLMNTVVDALNIRDFFDVLCSAELLPYGKPHPEVFLNCAIRLNIANNQCLVIEDSVNGVIAGKAAQMKVVAIPEHENKDNPKFAIADYKIDSLLDLIPN